MLTFFSTPKPFQGYVGTIQRNAIRSWTLLDPDAEVILFGDDDGAVEASRELGIRHEPEVQRNEYGTKYLASIFDRAQGLARHEILCYVNCDIILTADFRVAVERVAAASKRFLVVGRRWDVDIRTAVDFAQPDWQEQLRALALQQGRQRPPQWIDYFAFSRSLYHQQIPPFVVGRPGWDNWLLWHARASGALVVDASAVVVAVHQNHDYAYHPQGEKGVWEGEEAQRNHALLGGERYFRTIENATHRLTLGGVRRNWRHWWALGKRTGTRAASRAWFAVLDATRPVRHRLGLRQAKISRVAAKDR
jgi:hypothetical protein